MSRDGTDPAMKDVGVPPDTDGHELIGRVLDGAYQLEAVLGRGGMGLVFRATQLGLRREVALKVLHPSLAASSDVRNRFERERIAAGKIDHPNCVAVYDAGQLQDGSWYLAMELLEGKSLADVLEQEGQLAPGRALHILAHILRGLGHIHQAGLIHRDIKPENIFLIQQGQDEDFAKILDFGIAKGMTRSDLDDGVKLTQAGMAFGTPIYMAPEQALGNPMDGRADLYAAAVLGYEMLCGQPPFYSDDKLEVMSMHTAKPVPPMRQRLIKGGKPVPSSIERLIVKGLTKKPVERYANADVFLAAVEEALETPDGGVTDVNFERPNTTGSQPLVSDDGSVQLSAGDDTSSKIADAIEDVLATPMPPMPVVKPPVVAPKRAGTQPPQPPGGVGLGLPYTGPTGEPIFGLTPEQRLAQAQVASQRETFRGDVSMASALEPEPATTPVVKSPRKRWPIYAGIAALAVTGGIVAAVLSAGGGEDDEADKPEVSPVAREALDKLDKNDADGAIKLLEAQGATIEKDPDAQLALGHAYGVKQDAKRTLAAYARAMSLRREAEEDRKLRSTLHGLAGSRDPAVAASTFDLWVRTTDPEAKAALSRAVGDDDLALRHALVPVVVDHKLESSVDLWVAYAKDLQQEQSCDARKQVVAKMRALKDKRVIPALERAIALTAHGAPKGKYNWCLLDDAAEAIAALSSGK